MLSINNSRSYVKREALLKSVEQLGLGGFRCVIVCNEAGRYTAIFAAAQDAGFNIALPAHLGFMVFG